MRLNYRWDLTGFEEEEVSGFGTTPPSPLSCLSVPPSLSHYLLGTHMEAQAHGAQARLPPACSLVLESPAVARATVGRLLECF